MDGGPWTVDDTMITSRIRRPAVAGYWYPTDPRELRHEVARLLQTATEPASPARGILLPHGSYRHAGSVIGATLGRTIIPRRCIILAPSHLEHWTPWSLLTHGAYRTPLGDIPIDTACAETLRARCPFLAPDETWQRGEHAIEVLLPFLQSLAPADLAIVPVLIGSEDPQEWACVSKALAQAVLMQEEPVLVIASSDLSHYLPEPRTAALDGLLIDAIRRLDAAAFLSAVQEHAAIVCGAAAIACWLGTVTQLGATTATLASYGTSAAAGGDPHSAIGYAGLLA